MGKYVLRLQGRQHAGDRGGAEARDGRVDGLVREPRRRGRGHGQSVRRARRRSAAARRPGLTGYSIVNADSLDDALAKAGAVRTSNGANGGVEVYETIDDVARRRDARGSRALARRGLRPPRPVASASAARRCQSGSAQSFSSSTTVAAETAMSCTLIHSRTEWNSLPPVKRFGVGRPISVSREPSVPPRIECEASARARPAASPRARPRPRAGARRAPRACCGTAPSARSVTLARGSSGDGLLGEPPHERLVTCQRVPVEVAEDQRHRDALGAARDLARVDEALAALGRLGRERVRGQARDEPRGRLDRVDELPFRGAGVDADAVEGHLQLDCRPGLVLDLADDRAVERVGEVGAEVREVEVVGAAPDLLVDRERDPRACAGNLGMCDELGDRGHDLGDAGLVVGAEQRRPVGGDDVVADALGEERARRGREHRRIAARRRRSLGEPAARRRRRARPGSCRRARRARPSARRRRAASRRRSRARSARRRRARARAARRRAAGRGRAASACSGTSRESRADCVSMRT